MAFLREARRRIAPSADDGFEVSYVADDGAEHRVPLAQASAVPLEQGMPVRRFTSRKGQRHLSGLWWSATTGRHVGFESWLERDHLLHLAAIELVALQFIRLLEVVGRPNYGTGSVRYAPPESSAQTRMSPRGGGR